MAITIKGLNSAIRRSLAARQREFLAEAQLTANDEMKRQARQEEQEQARLSFLSAQIVRRQARRSGGGVV